MLHDIAPGSASSQGHAVLHTAADVTRLIRRLFIWLEVPRIEVNLHALPALHMQHTQERLEQLRERTIGSWGEISAGLALAVGGFVAWTEWTSLRQWQQMGNVLLVTAAAWLAGQALEAAWRRLRLIWALRQLRRQLLSGKGLYRIELDTPVLPALDMQRTQQRITLLSASCNCVLGAMLAAMTMLAGGLYILMTSAEKWWEEWWEWPRQWDPGPGLRLTLLVVGAGVAGWLLESVLTRLRLAAVLLGLWGRLRAVTKDAGL